LATCGFRSVVGCIQPMALGTEGANSSAFQGNGQCATPDASKEALRPLNCRVRRGTVRLVVDGTEVCTIMLTQTVPVAFTATEPSMSEWTWDRPNHSPILTVDHSGSAGKSGLGYHRQGRAEPAFGFCRSHEECPYGRRLDACFRWQPPDLPLGGTQGSADRQPRSNPDGQEVAGCGR